MQEIKGGDTIDYYVYFVKEFHEKEVVNPDGSKSKITSVDSKLVLNPPDSYLNQDNVQIVSQRKITVQIMEINKVGGKTIEPHYIVGMRFIDNGKPTNVFHILVKDSKEFREKIKKELEYYLKVAQFVKP